VNSFNSTQSNIKTANAAAGTKVLPDIADDDDECLLDDEDTSQQDRTMERIDLGMNF